MIRPAPRRQEPLGTAARAPRRPGVDSPPRLRDAAPKRREADLTKAVLDYLAGCPGVFAFRANSGAMFGEHKGKGWAVRFGFPGCADILGWVCEYHESGLLGIQSTPNRDKFYPWATKTARFLALEVKLPGWKPRNRKDERRWEQQQAFLQRVRDAGGLAARVESVEQVRTALGR